MRFIPTFDARVEQLKLEAKKIQRKQGGKHTDLLNRVARGAGYDHWHHVVLCHRRTTSARGAAALLAECESVVLAERRGEIKVVMTGPEVEVGPFVLFSTGIGDAWLLSPTEDLGLCLMWHGQVNEPRIEDSAGELKIGWDAIYEIAGDLMRLAPFDERIPASAVGGYPVDAVRSVIDRAQSFR
jgi:hypothetical protein